MKTSPKTWQAPIDLGVLSLPEWPKKILPEKIQKFVDAVACSTETPIELPFLTVLSAISAAAHQRYVVQVKSDYSEPVNIWTAIALPPGCRKTAVFNFATAPLVYWEKEQKKKLEPQVARMCAERKNIDARIKELRRKMAQSNDPFDALNEEILSMETKMEEVPAIPQIWTSDVTPENLAVIMEENNESMAVLSDEAGIFDILGGRYSGGIPNLDLFLQAHAGSSIRVNRGSRPPVFMENPTLTMCLTPQPEILRGLTKNPVFRGRGLLARFLYALPASNLGKRSLDTEPVSEECKKNYHDIISSILEHPIDSGRHVLKLSEGAYEVWHQYARVVEIRMSEESPYAHITDWAAKLPGATARMCGVLHIARYAKKEPWLVEISEDDMRAAVKIAHILSEHALAVFDLMGADPALEGARVILKWVKRKGKPTFTFRDCHHDHKSRFKRTKDLEPSIEILEERHYVREAEKERVSHRPSRIFEVNPLVLKEKQ